MRYIISAATLVTLVVASGAAQAQGNWSGFYIGGSIGGGVASLPINDLDNWDSSQFGANLKGFGWLVGAQAGYNRQLSQTFLLGVETDFNWTDFKAADQHCINNPSNCSQPPNIGTPGSAQSSSKIDYFTTLRARFGLVSSDTMLYLTGGAAFGHVSSVYNDFSAPSTGNNLIFSAADSNIRWGFVAGAGIEHKINERWVFRGEYLYLDFLSKTFNATCTTYGIVQGFCQGGNNAQMFRWSDHPAAHLARIGLNYTFK